MKKGRVVLFVMSLICVSCGLMGKTAAKKWTKDQIAEFISSCEQNASRVLSSDKVAPFCECALDVVAKEYMSYEDVKKAPIKEVLKRAKDCRD